MDIIQRNRLGRYNGLYYNSNYYGEGDLYMDTYLNSNWGGLHYSEHYKSLGYEI